MNRRPALTPAALLALVCLLLAAGGARAQGERPRAYSESPLPPPTGYVTDNANVIDAATEERLTTVLTNLKTRADIEFAVVTVPTTGETPIFDYSLSVARGWGIGSKVGEKNGLLLLVAVSDRKYQTQVSRHLEGDLPDGLVGEIARQRLRPAFQQGDYGRGVFDFVQAAVATLGEKRGFSVEGIDQSYAYRPPVRQPTREPRGRMRQSGGGLGIGACCCIGAVVALLLLSLGGRGRRGGGGRGGWGGGGGLLNALLLANVFSSLAGSGRGSSSGWGGGGGGGGSSSGWGGGGFGGFGGGGDFGGGGSGGDW